MIFLLLYIFILLIDAKAGSDDSQPSNSINSEQSSYVYGTAADTEITNLNELNSGIFNIWPATVGKNAVPARVYRKGDNKPLSLVGNDVYLHPAYKKLFFISFRFLN